MNKVFITITLRKKLENASYPKSDIKSKLTMLLESSVCWSNIPFFFTISRFSVPYSKKYCSAWMGSSGYNKSNNCKIYASTLATSVFLSKKKNTKWNTSVCLLLQCYLHCSQHLSDSSTKSRFHYIDRVFCLSLLWLEKNFQCKIGFIMQKQFNNSYLRVRYRRILGVAN
jgi:hypothetical protein